MNFGLFYKFILISSFVAQKMSVIKKKSVLKNIFRNTQNILLSKEFRIIYWICGT